MNVSGDEGKSQAELEEAKAGPDDPLTNRDGGDAAGAAGAAGAGAGRLPTAVAGAMPATRRRPHQAEVNRRARKRRRRDVDESRDMLVLRSRSSSAPQDSGTGKYVLASLRSRVIISFDMMCLVCSDLLMMLLQLHQVQAAERREERERLAAERREERARRAADRQLERERLDVERERDTKMAEERDQRFMAMMAMVMGHDTRHRIFPTTATASKP